MIRHTVAFRLKHALGSAEERDFLAAACRLAALPGVDDFECLRQVGKKNSYTFGLSMAFATPQAYAGYDAHPEHKNFVLTRWLPEVEEFIELDYEAVHAAAA